MDISKSIIVYNNKKYNLSKNELNIGSGVIITFIGLYLGLVFAISSATILAIKELSKAIDSKEKYIILKKIGANNKMVYKSLFNQIAITFLFPLIVAIIHSYFGISQLNKIIIYSLGKQNSLIFNSFIASLFIVIIYGGYFIATYLSSKMLIEN